MAIERVKFLSEIVISLDKSFIRVAHSLKIIVERLNMEFEVLNILICYPDSLV